MLCLLWSVLPFYAAQVDTLMVKSPSMNKEVQVVVVVPDIALERKLYHVLLCTCCMVLAVMPRRGSAFALNFRRLPMKKELFLYVPMVKTVGIGIARRIRIIATRLLSLQK